MASGDVVNQNMTGITVWQPAATVEIIVINVFIDNNAGRWGFTNGVWSTYNYSAVTNFTNVGGGISKIGITNATYWTQNTGTGATQGFSGIQIK